MWLYVDFQVKLRGFMRLLKLLSESKYVLAVGWLSVGNNYWSTTFLRFVGVVFRLAKYAPSIYV